MCSTRLTLQSLYKRLGGSWITILPCTHSLEEKPLIGRCRLQNWPKAPRPRTSPSWMSLVSICGITRFEVRIIGWSRWWFFVRTRFSSAHRSHRLYCGQVSHLKRRPTKFLRPHSPSQVNPSCRSFCSFEHCFNWVKLRSGCKSSVEMPRNSLGILKWIIACPGRCWPISRRFSKHPPHNS